MKLPRETPNELANTLSHGLGLLLTLVGAPGLSIPSAPSGGMPVGLQLLGRNLDEALLLRVADAFQRRTDHHLQSPPEPA